MKIAVIGATGKAGSLIASEAKQRGHEVTAIIRNKRKLEQGLYPVLERDIMELTTDDVHGFDAVVSAYGCAPGQEELQVEVMKRLIAVFEQLPHVRLLVVGGAGSLYIDETLAHQLLESLPPTAKLPIYMAKALELLRASKVNWTFLSPALRFDPKGRRTGNYTLGSEYIIKNDDGESYISYADYAIAMVDEAENNAFGHKRFTAVAERFDLPEAAQEGRRSFVLHPSHELAGQNFHLVMDDGNEYVAQFLSGEVLSWAGRGEAFANHGYQCAKVAPKTYFVSFFCGSGDTPPCLSVVLDLKNSLVTTVKATVGANPTRSRLTTHQVTFGAIKMQGEPLPALRHSYSADLVGKKIAWQYSPTVRLTHIYLSEHYMRGSLKNMPPVEESMPEALKQEIADRARRWGALFFEEPCYTIKIKKNLYLLGMIEDFRNRVNPQTGGGDLVFVINTDLMQDFLRSITVKPGAAPELHIGTALGEFIEEPDEMETAISPYRLE